MMDIKCLPDYLRAKVNAAPRAGSVVQCGNVRITVISPCLVRIEQGAWTDDATLTVIRRDFGHAAPETERAGEETGTDGFALLGNRSVRGRLDRMRETAAGEITREDAVRRLAQLAFGRVNEAAAMALRPGEADPMTLDLSAVAELERTQEGGLTVVCHITNGTDTDAYNPTIAFGLYAENGGMLYADGTTLQNVGIPAGGTLLMRFPVDEDFVAQWDTYGMSAAEARVSAAFRNDED